MILVLQVDDKENYMILDDVKDLIITKATRTDYKTMNPLPKNPILNDGNCSSGDEEKGFLLEFILGKEIKSIYTEYKIKVFSDKMVLIESLQGYDY